MGDPANNPDSGGSKPKPSPKQLSRKSSALASEMMSRRFPHPSDYNTDDLTTGGGHMASHDDLAESSSKAAGGTAKQHHQPKGILRNTSVHKLVASPYFDGLSAAIITLNAATIGISTNLSVAWAIENVGSPELQESPLIRNANLFYILFYICELTLKFLVFGPQMFILPGWGWNVFDLSLVVVGVYDLVSEVLDIKGGASVTWLRLLRFLRMVKMLRMVRVMRFFKVLRNLCASIAGSMMTLFWSVLMLTLVMYIFGLCFLQGINGFLTETDSVEEETMEGITLYWCSIEVALVTLYMAVTGGADWEPLAEPVKEAGVGYFGLFLFYIAFTAFAVLNVLTGMFVDTAMKVAQSDDESVGLELYNRVEIDEFRQWAEKEMGEPLTEGTHLPLTWSVLVQQKDSKVVKNLMNILEIQFEDCYRVFRLLDTDSVGEVDLEEFIRGCIHGREASSALDMINLTSEAKLSGHRQTVMMQYLQDRFDELHCQLGLTSTGTEPLEERLQKMHCLPSYWNRQESEEIIHYDIDGGYT